MNDFIYFFSLQDPNIRYVVIGVILLTASSSIVGTFAFLRKKSLVGDAVAHSVLPGVCLAFIISGTKNPLWLIIGAFLTGWLSLVLIDYITKNSKIKEDAAIGLNLSVFFGFGMLLLTYIQHAGNASQSGLDHFLFGKAAALVGDDLLVFGAVAILLLGLTILFFKEFTLISFDIHFAQTIGVPIKFLQLVMTTLTVLAVVIGIQAVGVVLMAAILITPAAAARFWTENIKVMMVLGSVFGAISGMAGAYISYLAPAMPTGPWIVVSISSIALFSFFFSPSRGILSRLLKQMKIKKRMSEENILKALYHMGEKDKDFYKQRSVASILEKRGFQIPELKQGLRRLKRQGFCSSEHSLWKLTPEGKNKGQRTVKLHRLWEVYLTKYVKIAADHVHEDAETIEHFLTPELEQRLEKLLDYPTTDPHQSTIPYA